MHDVLRRSNAVAQNQTVSEALDLAIVVLNYNTVDLLRGCLRSVFASGGDISFRVCVVDNASADSSAEMVRQEFPQANLIVSPANVGYSAGNNLGLRWFGFGRSAMQDREAFPRYALLLNPDTVVSRDALSRMVAFMDDRQSAGVAGPRVRRQDGSLDRACRRSFPTPQVSLYRMTGLSRLFPRSQRFNAYNMEYLPEDSVHPVDSVVGAFMMVRAAAIQDAGLLDESFFMYGEDLDWAKRIRDAGWENWYNGGVEITHVKEASSRLSVKSRVDFYEAMWIFYRKHYQPDTNWLVDKLIRIGVVGRGGLDVTRHLWRFCSSPEGGRGNAKTDNARVGSAANVKATVKGMPEA